MGERLRVRVRSCPPVAELLAAYDAQVRSHVSDPLPRGMTVKRDGPLLRLLGLAGRGFVLYRDLGGLASASTSTG